jgi:two-component system, OmpR family, response regulator
MNKNILVVDDDPQMRELLDQALSKEGYSIFLSGDGAEMKRVLEGQPIDLVLLDLVLPDADGLHLARYLRDHTDLGIIMLTGKGDPVDFVVGLEMGADDYVAKPFRMRELIARIRSVLRRSEKRSGQNDAGDARIQFAGWQLDLVAQSLTSPAGLLVELTAAEFRLLATLAQKTGEIVSRADLHSAVHRRAPDASSRSVDVLVSRLREKLAAGGTDDLIKTVRGSGYLLDIR